MKIDFEIIAHRNQRYPSAGDYYLQRGVWLFRVSRMKDKRYSWLVFAHELLEWMLCRLMGVRMGDIDKFDLAYEAGRSKGSGAPCGCELQDEPGNDIHAPYHVQHVAATRCERLLAEVLGVDWDTYDATVENL